MTDTNPALDLTPPSPHTPTEGVGPHSLPNAAERVPADATAAPPLVDTTGIDAPRTRWAAIIWGLLFAAVSATALWITIDSDRRDAVSAWVLELSPPAAVAYLLLVAGSIALIGGLVGIARRLQRGPRSAGHA